MQYISSYSSPLGEMLLSSDCGALTGAWFVGQNHSPNISHSPSVFHKTETPAIHKAKRWLDVYFSGRQPDFVIPLNPSGTAFQQEVWSILCGTPYGGTTTYGSIAKLLAQQRGLLRMSAQAVGGAVGRNPISVIIPCHRVLGADGSLTGYAGGLERKAALLHLERDSRTNCGLLC